MVITEHVFNFKDWSSDGIGQILGQIMFVVIPQRVRIRAIHRPEVVHHGWLEVQQTHNEGNSCYDATVDGCYRPGCPATLKQDSSADSKVTRLSFSLIILSLLTFDAPLRTKRVKLNLGSMLCENSAIVSRPRTPACVHYDIIHIQCSWMTSHLTFVMGQRRTISRSGSSPTRIRSITHFHVYAMMASSLR